MSFCHVVRSTIFSVTRSISLPVIRRLVASVMCSTGIDPSFRTRKVSFDIILAHGIRLCPNIKPCLLRDHPRFKEAETKGLFIHDEDGKPTMVQFWDEVGAYLDFTNPKTVIWWKSRVAESLLKYGVVATWNDNNEFESGD